MNSTTPFSPLAFTAADTGVGLGVGSGVVTIGGVVVGGEGVVPVVHVVGQSGRPAAPHPAHVGVLAEHGSSAGGSTALELLASQHGHQRR